MNHILIFGVFCNEFMALRHLFIYILTKALNTRVFKDLALSLYIRVVGLEGYTLPPLAIVVAVR